MGQDIIEVSEKIMTILELFSRPMKLRELEVLIGEPYYLVNFSLAYLFKKGQIHIKSKDGIYVICKKKSSESRICETVSQV